MKAMLRCIAAMVVLGAAFAAAAEDWTKAEKPTIDGRRLEIVRHGVKPEWGYAAPQQDTYVVMHPRTERKNAPLYVVLHSAGHDVVSCLNCTPQVGNHDLYRTPDDFYGLYLDCRANPGDWWWGGRAANDTGEPTPVEKRVVDTVKTVIAQYGIDANRVYLCGISMGGSGTLGIGMRNGDLFAAIKADVPAGIEHVSKRMYFAAKSVPESVKIPDPPIVIDYSAPNDNWSAGHERFISAMNERRYALIFYWGPFGHAHNSAEIKKVNDLIDSFDWLNVKKDELYPVFTNATSNDKIPWPDNLNDTKAGQINGFFRWKTLRSTAERVEMSVFLTSPAQLRTMLRIPAEATADVSLRRITNLQVKPGETLKWTFGSNQGEVKADDAGLVTIPGLKITAAATTLTISR